MRFLKRLLRVIFLCALALALIALGYYLAVTHSATLQPEKLLLSNKQITIYDQHGDMVNTAAFSFQKQSVPIGKLPQHLQDAFVAIEDQRFFTHHGFDFKRICGALLHNLQARSFKEGASTISQQLIKNTHLTQDKTLKRKLREWKLTRQLEKRYSKAEILEKYLNSIYFGHDCFGIGAAAAFYFDKTPDELSIAQSAMLAGLVKSPNNYSPFRHPQLCLKRRNLVLNAMRKSGKISAQEQKQASAEPLPTEKHTTTHPYLEFVFNELGDIVESKGIAMNGCIEIVTHLDPGVQNAVDTIAKQIEDCEKQILVLDQNTKGYKAAYSSVGNIRRLPGSLIKPLLVYAPAMEENLLSPATAILDEPTKFGDYRPENYMGNYYGYVSARECVEKSLNVPAVKTLAAVGVPKAVGYLEKMGLAVPKEDYSLALALGGMKEGFSLQELTSAYATFPDGLKKSCGFIFEVKINGQSVYRQKQETTRVFSEDSAYLMTDIMKSTVQHGTAKKLRTLPFDIAAKTGTVGTKNGNTDAYSVSFTAKDLVSVWLGNADNQYIPYVGGNLPCNVAMQIHEYLYDLYQQTNTPIPSFQKPKGVVCVTLDKAAYEEKHSLLLADPIAPKSHCYEEYFKENNLPTNQSSSFSSPSIIMPTAILEYGKVKIIFDASSPDYYQYRIDKYDYVKHNTVYFGDRIDYYLDEDVLPNKKYVYTITPVYKNHIGEPQTLPILHIKDSTMEDSITEKPWWDY